MENQILARTKRRGWQGRVECRRWQRDASLGVHYHSQRRSQWQERSRWLAYGLLAWADAASWHNLASIRAVKS